MLWERPQKLALQKWIICKLSWDIGLQLETLTDYAAFVGSPRLLELYSKGLPIAVREKALEIAIQNGCSHVVKALLSTGSLVNLTSFNGHCLLLGAAQKGFLREVNEVPNKVLEIETKAHLVKTSFFLCAENSHEQAVEVLLDNGIDVDARDNEWQTPLLRAVYRDSWPIMKLLLRKGATIDWRMWMIDEPVRHAVGRGDLGLLQQLLGLGLNPTTRDWDGDTPLHLACEFGLVEFIGPLIQAGAPPSIRNPSGKTPLHHALSMGEAECAKYLLEHGADISARDHNGDTPLHSAARFPKEESVQVLLEAGADCNALSWQNKTPLDEACRDYIVDLLVKYGAKTGSRLTKSVSKTPGLNPTQPKAGPATILARPTQVRNFSRLLKHPG
ncbi:ankyrin repeat-containing domain protein [Phyllosticta capitalensis]